MVTGVAAGSARLTLIATILGSSMVFIDATVVNVALPSIQRELGGGLAAQQWVVDAYLLTLGSLILVGGSLAGIFGEIRMFTIGVAAFGIASVLCAVAPDIDALIAFRALQGCAGALLTPASLAVITATFAGQERGAAIGTWTAWSGVSTVAGPLLGGWLIGVTSWRVIFVINVPFALAALAIALTAVPRRRTRAVDAEIDYPGALLCVVGLGAIVFGFIEQPSRGWDAVVWAALAGGAASLTAFVLWEQRSAKPMLPLRLFKRRNFSVANVETFAVYGGLSSFGFFLALFLQQLAGYSAFQAGLATLPLTLALFLLSRVVGRWSARVGPRLFMSVGPLMAGVATLAISRLPTDLVYWRDLLLPIVLFGIGLALTVAPLTTTVLADAGASDAGIASGVNNAVARVGGLVAVAVIGIVAAGGTANLTSHGFHVAMLVVGGLLVAGAAIGAFGITNR